MILHQWFASLRIWRLGKLYCPPDTVHRTFSMMALVIAPCHFTLLINLGNQIKNISGAKLGRASITPNVNFSNLNGFVQFFDHLRGAEVCCNTWVICCIRSNRDVLADYFSVVSTKIAASHEYWKCIMLNVGTLDFLLIFLAIVLAMVNMNKHFIFFKVIFYVMQDVFCSRLTSICFSRTGIWVLNMLISSRWEAVRHVFCTFPSTFWQL